MIAGGGIYAALCIAYFALRATPRGGDMPFGFELLLWPIVMMPLGWVGWVAPAFQATLSSVANNFFGTYHALEILVLLGNLVLWMMCGGLVGRRWKKQPRG